MNKFFPTKNGIILILLICNFINCDTSLLNSLAMSVDPSLLENGRVEGKMEINGVTYNAICDCNKEQEMATNPQTEAGPHCDPSKLKIKIEREGIGASFEDIRNLVGNIEALHYVSVPETSFRCLDGRNTQPVLATPGGDAGEFILALSVYEDLLGGGRKLTQDNVDHFLAQYLRNMKPQKFYMCTDLMSINQIEKELEVSIAYNI
jgi:hypothetical protein